MSERQRPSANEINGQLPDWAIKELVNQGVIGIYPRNPDWHKGVDVVSIDFRLGNELQILKPSDEPIDPEIGISDKHYEKADISTHDFVLYPNKFVIARTLEKLILPGNIMGELHGKSSFARIGVGVFVTSARFDPGWNGHPILEITNIGNPVILRAGMPICAFTFTKMEPVETPYNGRYRSGTVHSLLHVEKNNK